MPFINESDLQLGDVIFFTNVYKNISANKDPDEDAQHYVDHVGVFVGFDETNNPRIVHSIIGSKGHYYPEKISGLCITMLRALKDQVQEDGRVYDVVYTVFRSKFPQITKKALELLKQQASYRIPYDEKRLARKIELEDEQGLEGEDFKQMGVMAYPTAGIFRSIKYAARTPYPLTRTRGDGVGRGLTCSMSVILAYQIAELILDDRIIPVNPSLNEWPSDKYANSSSNHRFQSETYSQYLAGLKTKDMQGREQSGLKVGMHFWKGNSSPEQYMHKTFALDSKVVGSEGMYLYMLERQDAWKHLGRLEVAARTYSQGDKALHRQKLVETYRNFLGTISKEVSRFPLMCSPAKSPVPVPKGKSDLWWNKEDISTRICGENRNISQQELETLTTTDIKEALSRIANQLVQEYGAVELSIVMGLLLNSNSIHCIMVAISPMTRLPAFHPNRDLCYKDIFSITQECSGEIEALKQRSTIMFYPNDSASKSTYIIFLQILFERYIAHINVRSEKEKIALVTALTAQGKAFAAQHNHFDAISLYQMAQLIYCLLESPGSLLHQQMLQLFLLKIKAFNDIQRNDPSQNMSAHSKGEKFRAIDALKFMQTIMSPEAYAQFEGYPVVEKVKNFMELQVEAFGMPFTQSFK